MTVITLTIDDRLVAAQTGDSILQAAQEAGISIPTLCYLAGVAAVGACRLCLVEIAGSSKLQPACMTKVAEAMVVQTNTEQLQNYRRLIIEMLFAEGNHVCSVCVTDGHCELQNLAIAMGMDHVRLAYQFPGRHVDLSHQHFGIDHNRCVLCTRCIRVCDELEGAHTWDMAGRGATSHIIADLHQPWGTAQTCTACGKCVEACPTGSLFHRGMSVGEMVHDRTRIEFIATARKHQQWQY